MLELLYIRFSRKTPDYINNYHLQLLVVCLQSKLCFWIIGTRRYSHLHDLVWVSNLFFPQISRTKIIWHTLYKKKKKPTRALQPNCSCILWCRWVIPARVSGAKHFWTWEGSRDDISSQSCTQTGPCSCMVSALWALWLPRRSELKTATDFWHWSLQEANSITYFVVLWGHSVPYSVLPMSQHKVNCEYKLTDWCEGDVISAHANPVRILTEKLSSVLFSYSIQHDKDS